MIENLISGTDFNEATILHNRNSVREDVDHTSIMRDVEASEL